MFQNRIKKRFTILKSENRAGLITFITAGDPDFDTSFEILCKLPKAGADIIEVGMPFSDPMAEGPPIQASSKRALSSGMTLKKTLSLIRAFRETDNETPIIMMGYYNPIYVYGSEQFLDDAKTAGADGFIVVDLPPEADGELCLPAIKRGLNFIRLATPTTNEQRLPMVLNNTSGFVYYVSMTGITGAAMGDMTAINAAVRNIKNHTPLPVAVGFGVKTPKHAARIAQHADAVVVGSALVETVRTSLDAATHTTDITVTEVIKFVQRLAKAIRGARSQ